MRNDEPEEDKEAETEEQAPRHKLAYNVPQVIAARDALASAILCDYQGRSIEGEDVDALMEIVATVLRVPNDEAILLPSLSDLIGVPLTRKRVMAAAWRLAGNVPRLRRFWSAAPWTAQRFHEWVPFEIFSCRLERRERGTREIGAHLVFKALAGTPAGLSCPSWWSLRLCRFRAPFLGFSRPPRPKARTDPPRPYASPYQLVALRFLGLVQPELSNKAAGPGFTEIEVPGGLAAYNRELIRMRLRTEEGYNCPEDRPATFLCQKCEFGLGSCLAATHRADWVLKLCPECDEDGWFDKDLSAHMCVDCWHNNLERKK